MDQDNTHKISKSAILILPVMALAFYITFLPHQTYAYPLHIDEWLHMAYSDAMMKAGSTTFNIPFTEDAVVSIGKNLESGFHLFWGLFHQISGISWLTIYRYFPGIILAITVLSVYVLGERRGFGWEAALFVTLIPTTIGILGPSFLVPVSMGLLFVSISLFVAFYLQNIWGYLVLFVFTCFLVSIHAPSAICLVIILFPYILLNITSNFKRSLGLGLALIIPFLAPFPWIFDMLLPTARLLFAEHALPEYVDFPLIFKAYGYLPIGLCLLGILVLAYKGGKRNYGLVLGLLALLAMLVAFFTFHYGISIMYERGLIFMMLMLGITAGAGLMAIKNLHLPESITSRGGLFSAGRYAGWVLSLVIVAITLFISIPDRQDIPYYHMIDEEDYQAFVWIRDHVGNDHDMAILDPWKATAFTAVTGKKVFTRIHSFPKPSDEEAYKFLEDGCRDTDFLRKEGISVIYTELGCTNPDLTEVRDNVYVLK